MSGEDIRALQRELAGLRTQLGVLEARARQAWIYPTSSSSTSTITKIVQGGNTFTSSNGVSIAGIRHSTTSLISVPDPNPTLGDIYADGLGYSSDGKWLTTRPVVPEGLSSPYSPTIQANCLIGWEFVVRAFKVSCGSGTATVYQINGLYR